MTLYVGVDLGTNLAATAVDDDLACRWVYYRKRPSGESPTKASAHLIHEVSEALDFPGNLTFCMEAVWLNRGQGDIDPRTLFPLAVQYGYIHCDADEWFCPVITVEDSAAMARETGIRKDRREEIMPTLISGIDWTPYLGPRGGREAIGHLADSAFLAFVCHRQATWARKLEATG